MQDLRFNFPTLSTGGGMPSNPSVALEESDLNPFLFSGLIIKYFQASILFSGLIIKYFQASILF